MPHGTRELSSPGVLWLNAVSDAVIGIACSAIFLVIVRYVRQRGDLQYPPLFLAFALFIACCATTYFLDLWRMSRAAYWLAEVVKAISASVSVYIAILLVRLLPRLVQIPSGPALRQANLALEGEIAERIGAEAALRRVNETLEVRVAERTGELEAVNRTLGHDNERFAMAADAAGLGFWSLDVATQMLRWDERMFRLYGHPAKGDRPPYLLWTESLHDEDRARCEQELRDALRSGWDLDTEFRIVGGTEGQRTIRSVGRVVKPPDGESTRMFGVSFDLTDLRRAEEQFRLAIETAPTGMLMMAADGGIVLVNACVESMFGYSRAELLGRPVEMLVPERFRSRHPDYRENFFHEPRTRPMGAGRELYGLRKDGSEVPIEIGLTPLYTSAGHFVLGSIIDLSMRHAVDQMRRDFVSMVSHELRTPLTSINGSLGLLHSDTMGPLPQDIHEMIEVAYKNSGRLLRIINDILDIGKLEAGEVTIQRILISVDDLLRQAVEANAAYAERFGIRFVLDSSDRELRARGDPGRLMQVMTNLLSNAAKFSPRGADVEVRATSAGAHVRIEVRDLGPGIPEEFKPRIFEKFAQAEPSATRGYEGTGLGLSIARKLIEGMGGTIGFESAAGCGTTFFVELPRIELSHAGAVDASPG